MSRFGAEWYQLKLFAHHATGWSMDALHVVAGVLLQMLFATLLRSSLRRPLPLLLVVGFALLNEANDLLLEEWPQAAMQWGESAKDLLLTLLLPTCLYLAARHRPKLLR